MDITRITGAPPARTPVVSRPAAAPAPASRGAAPGAGLWDLLTPEEQAFFAKANEHGPLTYGPTRGGSAAPRGGRLDVKG